MKKNIFKVFHQLKKEYKDASDQVDKEQKKMRLDHQKMANDYKKFVKKVNKRFND